MPRKSNTQIRKANARNISRTAARHIGSQIGRLSDADVYALTYSANAATRKQAEAEAHQRAEAFAMGT